MPGKRSSTNRCVPPGEAAMASPTARPPPRRRSCTQCAKVAYRIPARLANAACDNPLRSYFASSSSRRVLGVRTRPSRSGLLSSSTTSVIVAFIPADYHGSSLLPMRSPNGRLRAKAEMEARAYARFQAEHQVKLAKTRSRARGRREAPRPRAEGAGLHAAVKGPGQPHRLREPHHEDQGRLPTVLQRAGRRGNRPAPDRRGARHPGDQRQGATRPHARGGAQTCRSRARAGGQRLRQRSGEAAPPSNPARRTKRKPRASWPR